MTLRWVALNFFEPELKIYFIIFAMRSEGRPTTQRRTKEDSEIQIYIGIPRKDLEIKDLSQCHFDLLKQSVFSTFFDSITKRKCMYS